MRYSSALVLSTLAIGQAAAGAHNARHASFHARRAAESKREIDYNNKDLYKDVDWAKINWNQVFDKSQSSQAQAAPSSSPEAVAVQAQNEEPTSSEAPAPTTSAVEAPKETKAPKIKNPLKAIGDAIEGLFDGIEEFCAEKGISGPGLNSKEPNGGIWIGDSDWTTTFQNAGKDDVWVACWLEQSFTGFTINVNRPALLMKIKVGDSQTVSFAPGASSACAPMYPETKLANFGGIDNAWYEVTMGQHGAFDVSRNVKMHGGASIEAVGSKCVSDMDTCVFMCKNKNAPSCMEGYDLVNCHSGNGGGQGYDPVMAGVGGGCAMGGDGEHISVTFSN